MKTNNTKKILEITEGNLSLSDKFNTATNNDHLDIGVKEIPQSWIKIHFKTYPRFKKISLDAKQGVGTNLKLDEILKLRRSIRQFINGPISKNELSYLLNNSTALIKKGAVIDNSRRPYPSAGGRYPLEIYPLVLNSKGIKSGIYHYNVKENLLELIREGGFKKWVLKATGGEKWISQAAVIFIITAVAGRTQIKYGDRGYRYILIEIGHLAQNILLLATALGLGSCAICGYIDSQVSQLLDITLQKEYPLYLIAVGKM